MDPRPKGPFGPGIARNGFAFTSSLISGTWLDASVEYFQCDLLKQRNAFNCVRWVYWNMDIAILLHTGLCQNSICINTNNQQSQNGRKISTIYKWVVSSQQQRRFTVNWSVCVWNLATFVRKHTTNNSKHKMLISECAYIQIDHKVLRSHEFGWFNDMLPRNKELSVTISYYNMLLFIHS